MSETNTNTEKQKNAITAEHRYAKKYMAKYLDIYLISYYSKINNQAKNLLNL